MQKTSHYKRQPLVAGIVFGLVCLAAAAYVQNWVRTEALNWWSLPPVFRILILPATVTSTTQVDKVHLVEFYPMEKRARVVLLAAQTSTDVLGGYGNYPLRSLYPLFTLDKRSARYMQAALSVASGKVIDLVLVFEHYPQVNNLADFRSWLGNRVFQQVTNMKRLEQVGQISWSRIFWFLTYPRLKWSWIDESVEALPKEILPLALDCPVAVVNQAEVKGLASKLTQLLEETGFTVVRTATGFEYQEKSKLIVDPNVGQCSWVIKQVSHLLPSEPEIVNDATRAAEYRAGVVLIIGSDLVY